MTISRWKTGFALVWEIYLIDWSTKIYSCIDIVKCCLVWLRAKNLMGKLLMCIFDETPWITKLKSGGWGFHFSVIHSAWKITFTMTACTVLMKEINIRITLPPDICQALIYTEGQEVWSLRKWTNPWHTIPSDWYMNICLIFLSENKTY